MSLQTDGVWKAGLWTPSVWANGVWYEIGVLAGAAASGGDDEATDYYDELRATVARTRYAKPEAKETPESPPAQETQTPEPAIAGTPADPGVGIDTFILSPAAIEAARKEASVVIERARRKAMQKTLDRAIGVMREEEEMVALAVAMLIDED